MTIFPVTMLIPKIAPNVHVGECCYVAQSLVDILDISFPSPIMGEHRERIQDHPMGENRHKEYPPVG